MFDKKTPKRLRKQMIEFLSVFNAFAFLIATCIALIGDNSYDIKEKILLIIIIPTSAYLASKLVFMVIDYLITSK